MTALNKRTLFVKGKLEELGLTNVGLSVLIHFKVSIVVSKVPGNIITG